MIDRLSKQSQANFFMFFFTEEKRHRECLCNFLIWAFENQNEIDATDYLLIQDYLLAPSTNLSSMSIQDSRLIIRNLHVAFSIANSDPSECPTIFADADSFMKWFYTWNLNAGNLSALRTVSLYREPSLYFSNKVFELDQIWEVLIQESMTALKFNPLDFEDWHLSNTLAHIINHYSNFKYPLSHSQISQLTETTGQQNALFHLLKINNCNFSNLDLHPGLSI